MTASTLFRIGARGSPLSRAQVARVQARMAAAYEIGIERIEFLPMQTSGDRIQDRPLAESGGKGLFTKELDEALLDGRIDLAIHSLKDVPTFLPPGIALAAIPEREDRRDAFISLKAKTLSDLPLGACIGTSSVRRQAQALHARPDLRVTLLRGNVQTRLDKIAAGAADATFLALAGLKRLGLESHVASLVDPEAMPPAACQGALGVTAREAQSDRFAILDDACAAVETAAERAFLAALDGSCKTPIAASATWKDGELVFRGECLTPDGAKIWRRAARVALSAEPRREAETLAYRLGAEIRAEAGDALLLNP